MLNIKKPNTFTDCVKFINTSGIMAVTGDYGNWIFCREFIPNPKNKSSEGYWVEKLQISSCQDPYEFDTETAQDEIVYQLKSFAKDFSTEERIWLKELYQAANEGEYEFIWKAWQHPASFETELIPTGKKIKYWFLVIMDAFDEICERMKNEER